MKSRIKKIVKKNKFVGNFKYDIFLPIDHNKYEIVTRTPHPHISYIPTYPTTIMRIYCLCLVFLLVFITATIASRNDRPRSSKLSASLLNPKNDNKKRKMQRKGGKSQKDKMNKKRTRMGRKDKVDTGRKNAKDKKRTRTRTRSGSVSDICLEQSLTVMKMWKDVISNFEKQKKRMEKQNVTGGNKSGKKGVFAPTARRLVDLGGGNKSELSCAGRTDNNGALQLKNLTDTLFDCEDDVHKACNPSTFPQVLM